MEIFDADILIWGICSLSESKNKRSWKPGLVELRASEIARGQADREAARIPWPRLLKARRDYIRWQAYLLWVRAIEEAEGRIPSWLAEMAEKHTRGCLRHAAEREFHRKSGPHPDRLWRLLERWINGRIFGKPRREGWMNAVGYYAVRDLAALRDEAYWSYCERQWKLSKPAVYPSFREWQRASEHCSDEILDQFEMREDHRELIKLSRRVSSRVLRKTVERYVDWQVFACWARTAAESGKPWPGSVEREVKRRCPGFLQIDAAAHDGRSEEPHQRLNRLTRWIEDREFARARKQGWFPAVVYQARLHPRHARVVDYWRSRKSMYSRHPRVRYPSFDEWQSALDAYAVEPEGV